MGGEGGVGEGGSGGGVNRLIAGGGGLYPTELQYPEMKNVRPVVNAPEQVQRGRLELVRPMRGNKHALNTCTGMPTKPATTFLERYHLSGAKPDQRAE